MHMEKKAPENLNKHYIADFRELYFPEEFILKLVEILEIQPQSV